MDDSEIFALVFPALRRFAAVVRPPDLDVDDLLQEALSRTLRATSLRDLDDPLVYLRRVVVNVASSHRRAFARSVSVRLRLRSAPGFTSDHYGSDLSELLRLPVSQRVVLYLNIVEGLTHDEVANHLSITAEASRARLSRGLRQLRIELSSQEAPR